MTGVGIERARQRERLAAALLDAGDAVQEDTLGSLLNAGEHRVMLEILLDQLACASRVLSRERLGDLRALSIEIGVAPREWAWITERLSEATR